MKKILLSMAFLTSLATNAQVGIGVGANSVNPSAQLEIKSTTKGLLLPRMTSTQRNAIASPAAGLVLWCTNCGSSGEMQVYDGTGWQNATGGAVSAPTTVTIGSQVWQVSNLDVAAYRNGDPIPEVTDPSVWNTLTTGAFCYYENNSANGAKYGKLYNWYAVNDPRGLAPTGYHVPTKAEWLTLIDATGGFGVAGSALKETGTVYWDADPGSTNSTGFSARGGGFREPNNSSFYYERTFSYYWASDKEADNTSCYFYGPYSGGAQIYSAPYPFRSGFSVRLIKD